MFYLSISIAAISIAIYHLFQKSISTNVHPLISLVITYAISLVTCLVLLYFFPLKKGLISSFRDANWASYLLGISVIGIEIGYLLAYRAGWKLTLANPFSAAISTLMLAFLGIFLFKENITSWKILGIIFCLIGVFFINYK